MDTRRQKNDGDCRQQYLGTLLTATMAAAMAALAAAAVPAARFFLVDIKATTSLLIFVGFVIDASASCRHITTAIGD